ncbi:MAG TPA: phosphotransferase [Chloroflexota bacterium]|nr:phosphotransferase [Chloroflexota bacterium]
MPLPTDSGVRWTPDDVRAFLAGYGRAPCDLQVEQLKSWWFNVVLRVEADGERLILRRYGVTPAEEVRWELAVLTHLGAHDFPTIRPLPRGGDSGNDSDCLGSFLGAPAILYPYVEGHNACDLDKAVAIPETSAAVAQLHALTAGLSVPYPRVRSGTESRRMVRELAAYAAARGVGTEEGALRTLLEEGTRVLADFGARLAPHADSPARLPRGVVHHDAHCANVLFHRGRLVALIDFDDACEGFLVDDLAVMVANWAAEWGATGPLDLDYAVLVVREYERHRRLTEVERELLPDFVRLFLLADASAYVQGRLEQGADGEAAVADCNVYQRYRHHAQDETWMAAFRERLWSGAA